jgi:hypothetical protein
MKKIILLLTIAFLAACSEDVRDMETGTAMQKGSDYLSENLSEEEYYNFQLAYMEKIETDSVRFMLVGDLIEKGAEIKEQIEKEKAAEEERKKQELSNQIQYFKAFKNSVEIKIVENKIVSNGLINYVTSTIELKNLTDKPINKLEFDISYEESNMSSSAFIAESVISYDENIIPGQGVVTFEHRANIELSDMPPSRVQQIKPESIITNWQPRKIYFTDGTIF